VLLLACDVGGKAVVAGLAGRALAFETNSACLDKLTANNFNWETFDVVGATQIN
jgi:predicted transcriptional regulator